LYISAFLTQSKSIMFHFDNISTSILFTFVLNLINKTTETMTSFAFSLILSAALNTPSLPLAAPNDSIQHRDIKEITVYSIAAGNLSLPYVSVDKKTLEVHDFKTPADALQNETGIWLSRDGIWATSMNVRGMSVAKIVVFARS